MQLEPPGHTAIPPDLLQGQRVRLRHWTAEDRAPFAAMMADPRVMQFLPGLMTRAQSDAHVARISGAIDERGRLPPCTRLATGTPSTAGTNEKSVSWLLSRKPCTICFEPKTFSIVTVMATALRAASTVETCVVDGSSMALSRPVAGSAPCLLGGSPGVAGTVLPRVGSSSFARPAK